LRQIDPHQAPQDPEFARSRVRRWTLTLKEHDMAWQKPQATDLRYGFEITMYISNR
jgi:coenzyme PQQ precursor peptide PqqA